jgi:hypothetical protein
MGFRYQLRDATGDDLGEAEYAYEPPVGDTIRLEGNRRARVLAVIPLEVVQEHVDRPLYGMLEIELLDKT